MNEEKIKILDCKKTLHSFLADVNNYLDFVNRVAELLRISDGIGTEALDEDITVSDLMQALVRKGELLQGSMNKLQDLAKKINVE